MTTIANPIYDSVFKFLLEDERVARILLSALLKKSVRDLRMMRNEYSNLQQKRISMFRVDFSARIADEKGEEHLVLIELQKTWLATETLRFRQYLGTQYLSEQNMLKEDNPKGYGLPIISIYILGHKVGDLHQPVVYVCRRYLDYDDNEITEGVPDPFVESLTHDSIIVQVPYLKGNSKNRLERLLSVFDQDCRDNKDHHLLIINDEGMEGDELLVVRRLERAAVTAEVRKSMSVEDEILSEIEARDTKLMLKDKEIDKQKKELSKKDLEISKQKKELGKQKEELGKQKEELWRKNEELRQKDEVIRSAVLALSKKGMSVKEIASILSISEEDAQHHIDTIKE